jgi:hypothetical protein
VFKKVTVNKTERTRFSDDILQLFLPKGVHTFINIYFIIKVVGHHDVGIPSELLNTENNQNIKSTAL